MPIQMKTVVAGRQQEKKTSRGERAQNKRLLLESRKEEANKSPPIQ